MATMLREVLRAFETARGPLSLNDMARDLDITPGMLDGMIEYWVRKGKIRECEQRLGVRVDAQREKLLRIPRTMPRSYELVTDDRAESAGAAAARSCVSLNIKSNYSPS